jgi:hypothetical protein
MSEEHTASYLVEALRYKPEGRGFDSRRGHWIFNWPNFPADCGPGVDSASNRNEYRESSWESIVYKMWEPRRLTTLWASTACYRDSFTFFTYVNISVDHNNFIIVINNWETQINDKIS